MYAHNAVLKKIYISAHLCRYIVHTKKQHPPVSLLLSLTHEFSTTAERPDINKKRTHFQLSVSSPPYCQLAVPSSFRGKSLGMLLTAKKITIVNNVIWRKRPATSETDSVWSPANKSVDRQSYRSCMKTIKTVCSWNGAKYAYNLCKKQQFCTLQVL